MLPVDLLGVNPDPSLEDLLDEWIAEITAAVSPLLTGPVATDLIRHGVLARAYRAAAGYWAKRPSSATLNDQGSMTWGNVASIYAELAATEEALYSAGVIRGRLETAPTMSIPTQVLP